MTKEEEMDDSQNSYEDDSFRDLTILWKTPQRDQEKAAEGRLAFLQAAREIKAGAVSQAEKTSHKGWMQEIRSFFVIPKKEHSPMLTAIATFLVITTLVLGGTGATVAAAQGSLPDSPLYDIKLMTENLRLELEDDPRVDFDLTQAFLDERLEEIQTMVEDGDELPEEVETGLQAQIEEAMMLAFNLPPEQAEQALEQMRARLETHLQALTRLQDNDNQHAFATVFRTRVMMLSKMKLVEEEIASQAKNKNKQEESAETPLVEETAKPEQDKNGNSKIEETLTTGAGNGNDKDDKPNKDATESTGNNGSGSDKPKVDKTPNPNSQSQPSSEGKEEKSNNGNGKKK